jgi:hypothetical protein
MLSQRSNQHNATLKELHESSSGTPRFDTPVYSTGI